jgi:MFS family permease
MSIWVVLLIILCNMTCWRASKVLATLFAIELGATQFYIGILVAVYSVFPMLLALYAGKLSDRLGVRLPMVAGSLGLALGLTLPYFAASITALYASAALIGASHVFYNVSVQNLVGKLGAPEDRTRNFSNYGLVMSMGSFFGPLIAGFSIDHFGHAQSYLYIAAGPLVSVALIAFARKLGAGHARLTTKEGPGSNVKDLLTNRPLRRTLLTGAAVLTGTDLFQFYMPIYAHSVGLTASAIGVVLAMFSAASFVVRLVMPALVRRWGAELVLTVSLFGGAIAYLGFPWIADPRLLGVIAFVLGLGMGCGQPLTLMLIYDRAPVGRSGEALGVRTTLNHFTHIVMPLFFGSLGTAFGIVPVFVANAFMLAGGGFISHRKQEK